MTCVGFRQLNRLVPIVPALLVLAPSLARAAVFYECGMDGQVRTACCCPGKAKGPDDSAPKLRAACCCKVTQVQAGEGSPRSAPPATFEATSPDLTAIEVVTVPVSEQICVVAVVSAGIPRGPPESLLARHCALLL